MEPNPTPHDASFARVISLDEKRRSRRARARRNVSTQPLVALWFGSAAIAAAAAVWFVMSVALRQGLTGLLILLAVASAISWKAAGSWARETSVTRNARTNSRMRHPSAQRARQP
jgi:hypothetical protein